MLLNVHKNNKIDLINKSDVFIKTLKTNVRNSLNFLIWDYF